MPTEEERTDAAEANMEEKFPEDVDRRTSPAEGELQLAENESHEPSEQSALAELRSTGKPIGPERMTAAIREFFEQRAESRKLLRAMMTEGVHWGYPPGFAPRIAKQKGVDGYIVSSKNKKTDKWEDKFVAKTEYTRTPSLYKAGAEIICDLFGARAEYGLTVGAKAVTVLCRLYGGHGALLGEGHGADGYGTPSGLNKGTKMAEKRALVNAVLDTFHLSDLFTQDLEDLKVEPYEAPAQTAGAPNVEPRDERPKSREPLAKATVSAAKITAMAASWCERTDQTRYNDPDKKVSMENARVGFAEFVQQATGREFTRQMVFLAGYWVESDLQKVEDALP